MRVGQARRRDQNEGEIVEALEKIGVVCAPLSLPGIGDVLCYRRAEGFRVLEIKNPRGRGKRLTPAQRETHRAIPCDIVTSPDEALALFAIPRKVTVVRGRHRGRFWVDFTEYEVGRMLTGEVPPTVRQALASVLRSLEDLPQTKEERNAALRPK
jgi:hypothetical protein